MCCMCVVTSLIIFLFIHSPVCRQPPVIRLYDLHVRLDASVKSGIKLLLLEKGNFPEMFRLEYGSKTEAKE